VRGSERDVEALMTLCAMALFMNAIDQRTYVPFGQAGADITPEEHTRQQCTDLNSIPLIERRHFCYVRGLALDLVRWFFSRYGVGDSMPDSGGGYLGPLAPIMATVAVDMVRYKSKAEKRGIPGFCSVLAFECQIKQALFAFEGFEEAYNTCYKAALRSASDSDKDGVSLAFILDDFTLVALNPPMDDDSPIIDYLEAGMNMGDKRYFSAVKGMCFTALINVSNFINMSLDGSSADDEPSNQSADGEESSDSEPLASKSSVAN
jgi:hypothetical protein